MMFTKQSKYNPYPNRTISETSSLLLTTDLQEFSTHEGKKIRKELLSEFPHVRSVSSDLYEVYRTQVNTAGKVYKAENDPESVKIYNKSASPDNKPNKSKIATYVRPEANVDKQKFNNKTSEKRKKLKDLVKTLIEARKKEKSKVAWQIYINVLKIKHKGFLERTQSIISSASPSTHLAKVFDDVYNTRLKSDSLRVNTQTQQYLHEHSIENYKLPLNHPNKTIQNFSSTTRFNPYLETPVTPSSLLNEQKFIWKVKPIDCLPTSAEGRLLQQNALLTSNMAHRLRGCGLIYKDKPVFHNANMSCVPKNDRKPENKPPNRPYYEPLTTHHTRLPIPRNKMTVLSTTSIKKHKNYKNSKDISRILPNNQNDLNYRFLRTLDYKLDQLIAVLHTNPIGALNQCNVGVECNVDQGPVPDTLERQEKCALHTIMNPDSDTFEKSYSNTQQKIELKYKTFLREWTHNDEKYERNCYSKDGGDSNDGRSKAEESHYWDAEEEKSDDDCQSMEVNTAHDWGPNREKDYHNWHTKEREHSRSDKDKNVADLSSNREKNGRDLPSKETDKIITAKYSPQKLQSKPYTALPPDTNTYFSNGCENLNTADIVDVLSRRLKNNNIDYWQPVNFINNDKSEKYFDFAKDNHGRNTEEIIRTKIFPKDIEETFTQYESIISPQQDVKAKQPHNLCETTQTVLPERKYIIIINQCLSNENYQNEMHRTKKSSGGKKDVALLFDENDIDHSSNKLETVNERNVHKNILQKQESRKQENVECNCKCNPVCYNPCCSKVTRERSKQIQCSIKISEKICQIPQEEDVQIRCSETILEKNCQVIKQPDQIVSTEQENNVPHKNSIQTFTIQTQHSDNKTNLENILLEELNKSKKAKRDIDEILGGDKINKQRNKLDVDLPSKDCCIEVSESFIRANNKTPLSTRRIAAVNTDPMGLLTLLSLSRETVGRLIANAQSSCCYYLTLPRIITPRVPITSYRAQLRNTTAPFQSTLLVEQASDRKSLLGKEHAVAPRDCCVCRHILQRHTNEPPKMSGCRYCGKAFTRANCLNLHEQQCFKIKGELSV